MSQTPQERLRFLARPEAGFTYASRETFTEAANTIDILNDDIVRLYSQYGRMALDKDRWLDEARARILVLETGIAEAISCISL